VAGPDIRNHGAAGTVDTTKALPLLKENLARFHDLAIVSANFSAQNIALAAGVFKLASIVMYNIKADAGCSSSESAKRGASAVHRAAWLHRIRIHYVIAVLHEMRKTWRLRGVSLLGSVIKDFANTI
jgi:hypothetical protein